MKINSSFATEFTAIERLDLNDIMELQLRLGDIELRSFIANKSELNVPLIELSIDTYNRVSTGQFDLVLRARACDYRPQRGKNGRHYFRAGPHRACEYQLNRDDPSRAP